MRSQRVAVALLALAKSLSQECLALEGEACQIHWLKDFSKTRLPDQETGE